MENDDQEAAFTEVQSPICNLQFAICNLQFAIFNAVFPHWLRRLVPRGSFRPFG